MKRILIFFLFLTTSTVFATVEYLTVNHMTKELYWAETESNKEGFIGWEIIPERSHHEDLSIYLELGYTYTKFPYKVDLLIGLIFILSILLLFLRMKKKGNS
ncbi:MAG: hypothetical protein AB8B59_13880 [Maribacter sp.]